MAEKTVRETQFLISTKADTAGVTSVRAEMAKLAADSEKNNAKHKQASSRVDESWDRAAFAKFLGEEKSMAQKAAEDRAKIEKDIAVKAAREAAEASKSTFEKINETFGRSSEFTHVFHALEGGGAVMGASMVANSFKEITGKAQELDIALATGKKTSGEVASELAKSIPVVGSLYAGVSNLDEVLSGAGAAAARMAEFTSVASESQKQQNEWVQHQKEQYDDLEKSIRAAIQARELLGMEGSAKVVAEAKVKQKNLDEDFPKEVAAEQKKIRDATNADLLKMQTGADLGKKMADLQKVKDAIGRGEWAAYQGHYMGEKELKEVKDPVDVIEKRGQDIIARGERAIAERTAQMEREHVAKTALNHGELLKGQSEHDRAMAEEARKGSEEIARAQADAARAGYDAQGDHLSAELSRLKEQYEKSKTEIEADAKKTAEDIPATSGGDKEEAARRLKNAKAVSDAQLASLKTTNDAAVAEARRKSKEEIDHLGGEARRAELKAAGRDREAALDALKESHDAQMRAGMPAAKESALNEKYKQDVEDVNRREDEQAAERKSRQEEFFRQQKIQGINEEIAAGNLLHQNELKTLQEEERIAQRKQALQHILADTRASLGAKVAAAVQLHDLPRQAAENNAARDAKDREDREQRQLRLREQAGDKQASRELRELEVKKQFREEREKLDGVIHSNASAQDRAQAAAQLGALDSIEKNAIGRASAGGMRFDPMIASRESVSSGAGIRGLSERAREDAAISKFQIPPDPNIKKTADATDLLAKVFGPMAAVMTKFFKDNSGPVARLFD